MADSLDVVAVGIEHESAVVIRVIMRANAGRTVIAAARGYRGLMECIDDGARAREDRVLIAFFRDTPQELWPRAVVIEHLSRDQWQQDCIADMIARGYRETGKNRSNTFLLRS